VAVVGQLIVKLSADAKALQEGLTQAQSRLEAFAKRIEGTSQHFATVGQAATVAGGAIAAGLGFAVKTAMDFDAQMSKVQALAGATEGEFKKLRDAAIELGSKSVYSASEAAEGMQTLAAAGFNTQQIIAAMPGLLNAAAAAGEDFANVSDIMVAAMSGFGLQAKDMAHIADVLASAANASAISIGDIGYSLKYIAPVAKTAGTSLEEVSAALAILGNAGIKADTAGTSLRTALKQLADPPKEAAKVLDQLGVSVTDASGKMYPLGEIIAQLHEKFKTLSQTQKIQAASTLFGSEAMSAMLTLIEAGPEQLGKLTKEFQNSGGAAQKMADQMTANLKGAFEELKGAIESAMITVGTVLTPTITRAAEAIQKLVGWFNSLPEPLQRFLTVGGIGLVVGAIPSVLAGFSALAGVFAAISGPVGIAIAAITALAGAAYLIYKNWDTIVGFVSGVWESVKTAVVNAANAVLGFLKEWGPLILAAITGPIGLAVYAIAKHWDEIKAGIGTAWEAIRTFAAEKVQAVVNAIRGALEPVVNIIAGIWNNVQAGLIAAWDLIKSYAFLKVSEVVTTIKTVLSKIADIATAALEWGKGIIEGLWQGIVNAASWLYEKLRDWAEGVKDYIAGLFGIHSPSRIAENWGFQVAAGLAAGIEKGRSLALVAARDLSSGVAGQLARLSVPVPALAGVPAVFTPPEVTTVTPVTGGGVVNNYDFHFHFTGCKFSSEDERREMERWLLRQLDRAGVRR
jgi:TP901 family phage tail tape measure protein